jgi:hypothetical protein
METFRMMRATAAKAAMAGVLLSSVTVVPAAAATRTWVD